jgi:hypothetical protein
MGGKRTQSPWRECQNPACRRFFQASNPADTQRCCCLACDRRYRYMREPDREAAVEAAQALDALDIFDDRERLLALLTPP